MTLGWDGNIVVWDIESGNFKYKYPKIESKWHVGCLSHDDKFLVGCTYDCEVRLYSLVAEKFLHLNKESEMSYDLCFTLDN